MEKANILVVDDDKEIAELVGIHLREEGYEVYKAYSGKEALEIFKQERIDLVILDVMMPVMDGNQVCSKIRDTSAVPIIMLSAKDAEMDVLMELSDRIMVLCGGEVSGILDARKTDKNEVGMLMTRVGGKEHEGKE